MFCGPVIDFVTISGILLLVIKYLLLRSSESVNLLETYEKNLCFLSFTITDKTFWDLNNINIIYTLTYNSVFITCKADSCFARKYISLKSLRKYCLCHRVTCIEKAFSEDFREFASYSEMVCQNSIKFWNTQN